jgi:hypothetical protein
MPYTPSGSNREERENDLKDRNIYTKQLCKDKVMEQISAAGPTP